jgi:hypothetical protein
MLVAAMVMISLLAGCRDENDPEYWLDAMYNRPWREKSLKTLNDIFNRTMQDNNSDLNSPKVKELVDLMVPELIKGYKEFTRDKFNRTEIIKLLAQMNDTRAIDTFMEGLSLDETGDSVTFEVSANALRRQGVESALPKLLEAHKIVVSSRSRRPGAPFTNSENEIEQAVISAATSIIAKNPSSSHKSSVVKMLCEIAETTDELQELRLNMKAIKGLGIIGDVAAIPTLIKGIAMKGKRQPVGLGQVAFAALQQIHNRDSVVEAVLSFAKGQDSSFNDYYKEEVKFDLLMKNPNWYLQEATNFLGQLNYASPKVIEFLTSELNHDDPDENDERAAGMEDLPVNFEPDGWAVMRRNWAAVALAQLAHKPVLNAVKKRMVFKKNTLQIQAEEAVGYVRALGILQYPEESCNMLLNTAAAGDDSLRDKAFYNASLMCGTEFTKPMDKALKKIDCDKVVKERFPDGASEDDEKQASNECDIMKKRIKEYMDSIAYGQKCGNDLDCHVKTLQNPSDQNAERAIYSLYRIGRDDSGKRDKVVSVLMEKLSDPSKGAIEAVVFAIDHLTPQGGAELEKHIETVWKELLRQTSYKDRARLLEALIGHVRNRTRGGGK